MCGIAGIIKFKDPVSESELRSMTDVIAHRGPDGEGFWINPKGNAGLAHRRLSIIDLSADGKQPMHFADRYTITFNGEIYNYIELKEKLIKEGYRFRTATDTEVILALFDQKKEKCLEDLDGMFAFAIWDEQEQQLFCARDRFGEKPFHYYLRNNQFVFASEIKQFWAYGIQKKMIDDRLQSFLKNGQIDNPNDVCETFYENIKRLDASNYMLVKADGTTTVKKWWGINLDAPTFSGSLETAQEQFMHLFEKSIRLRLRSDVPLGTSLSGGLDSSSIVMMMDKLKGAEQQQTTFSARFNNFAKDEGEHIETVVKACRNIQTHYSWPDENFFLENLDKINYHQDEPYSSTSIVAQYSVMRLAREKNITVLIDGQGADEYLAGYLPYYKTYLNQLFFHNKAEFKREYKAYNLLHGKSRPYVSPAENETLRMKIGRYKLSLLGQPKPYAKNALAKQLHADTFSMGLKTLLRYADRNSMAHSREVRLPFLSHELVEFVFSLPDEFKLKEGRTKYILRKSMDQVLPPSICWRVDKIGYESPQSKWLESPAIKNELENSLKALDLDVKNANGMLKWRALLAHSYTK